MFRKVITEECRVPADIKYLGEMRDFVTHVGRKYGVPERILNSLRLAVEEAGTNIIRHAYRDWEGFITLRVFIRRRDITVSLIDQGHTFDLRKVRDPDLRRYVDIGKKGGLGIFIIRKLVDAIDYRKMEEGNELRLIKHIPEIGKHFISLPGRNLPLKLRYALYSNIIFASILVIVTGIFSLHQKNRILRTDLEAGRALAKTLAKQSVVHLVNEEVIELARMAAEFQQNQQPLMYDALIVNTADTVLGAKNVELIDEPYPFPTSPSRVGKDILRFRFNGKVEVYDISEPVVSQPGASPIGHVHLLLDKRAIDQKIREAQFQTFRVFLVLLLVGVGGIFGLIYLIMSPLKRLVRWMKATSQGEIQEEVDFNTSDEIGEIAYAFNEITEKFRKSQENVAEQERLKKEMQVAQEIQHTLLPSRFPQIEGYEIASYYEAAREVGGDYFDFVEVDKDSMGIVVADVSGKGVPGSLIMTMIRTALRTEARGNKNAADVLARVNDFVINDMKRGMFVTVFYMILDSYNRTINYASAGHNPMILYRSQTKKSYYLNPRGFPIGLNIPDRTLFRKTIESDTIHLREGDVLIVYTDGITEAMNAQREKFGEERFLSVIRKYGHLSVGPLVEHIKEEIKAFTGGEPQSDDITLVAIKEKLKAEDVLFNLRTKLLRMVAEEGLSVKEACEKLGVSTSTYYKYKKRFEKLGIDGLREEVARSEVEERHIAIEDKVKILDIIRKHPDFGPKRISEELNTEAYGFTVIDEKRIYEELVKSHLNTRELREAFAKRGERGKRMKPPGTPFLTLDGQIIFDTKSILLTPPPPSAQIPEPVRPVFSEPEKEEKLTETQEVEKVPEEIAGSEVKIEAPPVPLSAEVESAEVESKQLQEEAFFSPVLQEEPSASLEVSSAIPEIEEEIANSIGFDLLEEELSGIESGPEYVPELIEESSLFESAGGEGASIFSSPRDEAKIASMVRELHRRRWFEAGQWFYQQGMYAKAIEEFTKLAEDKPDSWEAYQYLGNAWYRLGQLDKALEAYQRSKSLNPSNPVVLENLGVIFAHRGEYRKAVWQWGEILKWHPERTDILERIRRMQKWLRERAEREK